MHTFGECWLKWQVNAKRPIYGQRGRFTERFRKKNWLAFSGSSLTLTPTPTPTPTLTPSLTLTLTPTLTLTRGLHLRGVMPDGITQRNQTPPTHVPWTGGVMGTGLRAEGGWCGLPTGTRLQIGRGCRPP